MLKKKHFKKITKQNKILILIFTLISLLLIFIVGLLVIFKIIDVSWINGLVISLIFSGLGLLLIHKSWKVLLVTENPYLYVLLWVIRLSLYFVPFLLAFFLFDGEIFNYFGVIIGFTPLILFPWITSSSKILKEEN